ncbi:glycine-rich cell wall structural protein-like [Haliotis rubra]|uniref:glycine-rich cell wall structural protein-like n=1 Tax=Haliotis rubra TaxID=36100 RepID=UPI001EE5C56C|nr:glycine-rich cell wall structural protein-like [Haliotis rubra]
MSSNNMLIFYSLRSSFIRAGPPVCIIGIPILLWTSPTVSTAATSMKVVIAALSVLVCSAFAQVPLRGNSLVGGPLGLGFNKGGVIGSVGVHGYGHGYNPKGYNYGYGKGVAGPFVAGHGSGLVGQGPFVGHAGSFAGHGTFAVGNGPFVAGKGHGYGHNSYNGLGNGVGLVGNGLLGHSGHGLAAPLAFGSGVAGHGYGYGYNPYNNNYGYGKNVGHGAGLIGNGGHGHTGHGLVRPFAAGHGVAGHSYNPYNNIYGYGKNVGHGAGLAGNGLHGHTGHGIAGHGLVGSFAAGHGVAGLRVGQFRNGVGLGKGLTHKLDTEQLSTNIRQELKCIRILILLWSSSTVSTAATRMKVVIAALSVLVCSAVAQVPLRGNSLVGGPLGLGFKKGGVIGNAGIGGKGYGYGYNPKGYNNYGYGKGVAGPFVAGHGSGLVGQGPFVGHAGTFAGHGTFAVGNGPFVSGKGHGYGYGHNSYNGLGNGVGLVGNGLLGHAGHGLAAPLAFGSGVAGHGYGYGYNPYNNYGYGKNVGHGAGLTGNGVHGHTGHGVAGPLAVGNGVAGHGYGYGYNPYNNNYSYGKNVAQGAGLVGNGVHGHNGHGVAGHGLVGPFSAGHGVAGLGVGQFGVGLGKAGFGGLATGHHY